MAPFQVKRLTRPAVVVALSVAVGCSDVAQPPAAEAERLAEHARLNAIVRRIQPREICAEPFDAPARRANYRAAYERHQPTIDAVSRLDWRTEEITDAQVTALNAAKLQINRAEVIDLAIAVRQDFQPPAGRRVEAAYREHGAMVERLAALRWETAEFGDRDSKALARASEALLAARQIDLAEMLATNPGDHAAAALAVHGADVRRLAAKDWTNEQPTDAETRALGNLVVGHQHDVAIALARLIERGAADSVREAYDARRGLFQGLASKRQGEPVTGDEQTAVCDIMRRYR